jgi:hypothetical protein
MKKFGHMLVVEYQASASEKLMIEDQQQLFAQVCVHPERTLTFAG